jgi:hypothetical protein
MDEGGSPSSFSWNFDNVSTIPLGGRRYIVGDPTDDVPRASAHEYVKIVVLYLSLRGSVIANARPIWGIEISLRTE